MVGIGPLTHTADLSDKFFELLRAACARLRCDPLHMLGVMMNESGVHSAARNPGADANGLIQFMGTTLEGLGWRTGSEVFRRLSAEQQVPWVEHYFAPHAGHLGSVSAIYLATFLPAFLAHAGDPAFVLCAARGPLSWAYNENRSFDHANKGAIVVQDLSDAVTRACTGPRWAEIADRMQTALDADEAYPESNR